jgi:hypothetical protein
MMVHVSWREERKLVIEDNNQASSSPPPSVLPLTLRHLDSEILPSFPSFLSG